jgi:hypothetical protein
VPWELTLAQDGSTLTGTSGSGLSFTGKICGGDAELTARTPTASTTVTVSFADANTGEGVAEWQNATCFGTDAFAMAAGACP